MAARRGTDPADSLTDGRNHSEFGVRDPPPRGPADRGAGFGPGAVVPRGVFGEWPAVSPLGKEAFPLPPDSGYGPVRLLGAGRSAPPGIQGAFGLSAYRLLHPPEERPAGTSRQPAGDRLPAAPGCSGVRRRNWAGRDDRLFARHFGILLISPPGAEKSHARVAIVVGAIRAGHRARAYKLRELHSGSVDLAGASLGFHRPLLGSEVQFPVQQFAHASLRILHRDQGRSPDRTTGELTRCANLENHRLEIRDQRAPAVAVDAFAGTPPAQSRGTIVSSDLGFAVARRVDARGGVTIRSEAERRDDDSHDGRRNAPGSCRNSPAVPLHFSSAPSSMSKGARRQVLVFRAGSRGLHSFHG